MKVSPVSGGTCENCGATAPFASDVPPPSLATRDADIIAAARNFEPEPEHTLTDGECQMRPADSAPGVPGARCWVCRPAPEGFERMPRPAPGPNQQAAAVAMEASALRTREGDQVLPDGDESEVDDQTLLIRDIEERRRLGVQRYGQGHRPFNGRSTLRDAYEERLDELVYFRSILRMADATRDDLVVVVEQALAKAGLGIHGDYEKSGERLAAEVAVDRIMGWVGADILATNPISEMGQHEVASIADWSDTLSPDTSITIGHCMVAGSGWACTEPDHWPAAETDEPTTEETL
jgi:hypothetical protein